MVFKSLDIDSTLILPYNDNDLSPRWNWVRGFPESHDSNLYRNRGEGRQRDERP
jgi:hypothetical protein